MENNLLQYQFKNQQIYLQAITHRSWINENDPKGSDYQRLEFLGDSVLKLIQSQKLYNYNSSNNEGTLTQIRNSQENNKILSQWAKQLGIDQLIRCGKGINPKYSGWENICAQVFEALLGAIWIDCGYDFPLISNLYDQWNLKINYDNIIDNPKKNLQEMLQKNKQALPKYNLLYKEGQDHCPIYFVSCSVAEFGKLCIGQGKSIKDAEQNAAQLIIDQLLFKQ